MKHIKEQETHSRSGDYGNFWVLGAVYLVMISIAFVMG